MTLKDQITEGHCMTENDCSLLSPLLFMIWSFPIRFLAKYLRNGTTHSVKYTNSDLLTPYSTVSFRVILSDGFLFAFHRNYNRIFSHFGDSQRQTMA